MKKKTESFGEKVSWLWDYWKNYKMYLVLLFLFTIVSTVVTIAYPMVFKYVIDTVKENAEKQTGSDLSITGIVLILMLIGILRSLSSFYPAFRAMLNLRFEIDIRERVFSRVLVKGYRFFLKFKTGDLVTRLTEDLAHFFGVSWFMCSGIFRSIESLSKFLFCIGVMIYMDWKLTLVSVLPLPLMIYIYLKVEGRLKKAWDNNKKQVSKTNEVLENVFSGIKVVKAYNAESKQTEKLREILHERIGIEIENVWLWSIIHSFYSVLGTIGQIIVIIAGGYFVITKQLSLGSFYAFYVYLGMLLVPMLNVPMLFVHGKLAFVNVDRLDEISGFEKENDLTSDCNNYESTKGKVKIDRIRNIKLEDVSFTYDDSDFSVSDISIDINEGDKLAIVGRVASGKSTLLRIILGIIKPQKGRVFVNDENIENIDLFSYWKKIGYVPQEAVLFSESIAENIVLGREDAKDPMKMLEYVNMTEEVKLHDKGIDNELLQKGMSLSGGQRQRVAIARAMAADPDMIVMDDCTSALDSENELLLWNRLDPELKGKMCVMVTHRLATARKAGRVIVVESGRISKSGDTMLLRASGEIFDISPN